MNPSAQYQRRFRHASGMRLAPAALLVLGLWQAHGVAALPAFPGAEGFGTQTIGGRGGVVVRVTNLNDSGPGSFRAAMTMTQPRIIVFTVSGVINLSTDIHIGAANSFVTVLGQSSPAGITIRGGGGSASNASLMSYPPDDGIFHDGVFRFLRFRRQAGDTPADTISMNSPYNLVFDHMDFSGGADESFDITSGHDWTLQWSTVTNSRSEGGNQYYGLLIAYPGTTGITLHHNLMAHHNVRCGAQLHWGDGTGSDSNVPATGAQLDIRNNVLYNCKFAHLYRFDRNPPTAGVDLNLVGNTAKLGPSSEGSQQIIGGDVGSRMDLHAADNAFAGGSVGGTSEVAEHNFPDVTTTSAATAYTQVLAKAGAWPRDAMTTRTVAEVEAGTGQLGKTDDALISTNPTPPTDTDADGIPDSWETAHGLNPNSAGDSRQIHASGYANVEVYLNEIADQLLIVARPNAPAALTAN